MGPKKQAAAGSGAAAVKATKKGKAKAKPKGAAAPTFQVVVSFSETRVPLVCEPTALVADLKAQLVALEPANCPPLAEQIWKAGGCLLDDGSTLEGLGLGADAEISVSTLPPPADPWRKLRSPYGGKLSPADEWTKLCARAELGASAALDAGATSSAARDGALTADALDALTATAAVDAGIDADAPFSGVAVLSASSCNLAELSLSRAAHGALVALDLCGNQLVSPLRLSCVCTGAGLWLRELILAGNRLTRVPSEVLEITPRLLRLDLSFNPIETLHEGCFPDTLKDITREVILERCALGSLVAEDGQCALARLTQLRAINIAGNMINDAGQLSKHICKASFPQLQSLDLRSNPMTTAEAFASEMSAMLASLPTLKRLNGSEFSVTLATQPDALAEACSRGAFSMFTTDASSCSCVEGNPCVAPDNCKNWARRFEIALQVRNERMKYDKDFVAGS